MDDNIFISFFYHEISWHARQNSVRRTCFFTYIFAYYAFILILYDSFFHSNILKTICFNNWLIATKFFLFILFYSIQK